MYILWFATCLCNGSAQDFDSLLQAGKAVFKNETEGQNFKTAVEALEKAVKLQPKHAEAWYFLGYAYDRLNSQDAESTEKIQRTLTEKSSACFEKVIRLSPEYKGEIVILDPYSKISSIWGALALSYYAKGRRDLTIIALQEGKKRGGFGEMLLDFARKQLDICAPNSFLLSFGDNITFPLLYVQLVEKYRADVRVVDASLLESSWYAKRLEEKHGNLFGLPTEQRDTTNYRIEEAKKVSIEKKGTAKKLTWKLKGAYEGYIARGEWLLYQLLKTNEFERPVFFDLYFPPSFRIGIPDDAINFAGWGYQLDVTPVQPTFQQLQTEVKKIKGVLKKYNKKSQDENSFVDGLRIHWLLELDKRDDTDANKATFKKLLKTLAPKSKYPFGDKGLEKYYDEFSEE